jgi:hypothetical protein
VAAVQPSGHSTSRQVPALTMGSIVNTCAAARAARGCAQWSGVEWSGVEWSGVEWSGWSRVLDSGRGM